MIPTSPLSMFLVVEAVPDENYWHGRIQDTMSDDQPEFRLDMKKSWKGQCPYTIQQLANCMAGQLMEARGRIVLTEFRDGIPVFTSVWISNSRQVMCVQSSDPARCPFLSVRELSLRGQEFLQRNNAKNTRISYSRA